MLPQKAEIFSSDPLSQVAPGQIGKIVKFRGKDTLTIVLNNGTRLELFEGQMPQYKQELVQIDGKAKIA